jgi:transcriptional regulator with XRE-family HTH domain
MPTPTPIADAIRRAIEAYEPHREELSRRTGVDPAQLSRFVHGARTITIDTLERLAPELGLSIVQTTRRKGIK